MAEDAIKAKRKVHRGVGFRQFAHEVCNIECEVHPRNSGKISGQQPRSQKLRTGEVKTARVNGCKPQRMGAQDDAAEPCARTASRVENGDRAGAGGAQLGQFRFKERPDLPVGICVQAAEGKQMGRITIGIRNVIGARLIVGSRDHCGRAVMNHWIAESMSAGQVRLSQWKFSLWLARRTRRGRLVMNETELRRRSGRFGEFDRNAGCRDALQRGGADVRGLDARDFKIETDNRVGVVFLASRISASRAARRSASEAFTARQPAAALMRPIE